MTITQRTLETLQPSDVNPDNAATVTQNCVSAANSVSRPALVRLNHDDYPKEYRQGTPPHPPKTW